MVTTHLDMYSSALTKALLAYYWKKFLINVADFLAKIPASWLNIKTVTVSSDCSKDSEAQSLTARNRTEKKKSESNRQMTSTDQQITSKDNDLRMNIPSERDESPYSRIREKLYGAALEGDWQRANNLHKEYPRAVIWQLPAEMGALPGPVTIWELPITLQKMNALQVAVAAKQTCFVKKLLKYCMEPEELKFKNSNGDTVLSVTALSGSVEIAKKIVDKKRELLKERNNQEVLPLINAAMHRQRDMVWYLYSVSVTAFVQLKDEEKIKLLLLAISCDLYDIAKAILRDHPTLATAEDERGCTALEQLARKPLAIGSRISQMSLWEKCIGYCFNGLYHKALMRKLAHELVKYICSKGPEWKNSSKCSSAIFLAAELGNVEFLTILIRYEPDLIWIDDKDNRNIFHISIVYRQENVFNLIHEIGMFRNLIAATLDKEKNNMLHLAGNLVHKDRLNIVSGAALHMQRELLWFKEVEKIVPHAFLKAENSKGKTPWDLFTETHQTLQKDGEEWMRGTAMYCMLVATLIATVVFAATFTIPGGNDQGKGTLIFLELNWFLVFFVSNSIALISSSTSIFIFLSILTSRYGEKDFLSSLPRRLLFGLFALFISIVSMVVAFGATCFLVYQRKATRVPTVIIALAGVPITSFVVLHFELLVDIIRSTYWSKFLFRSHKRLFRKKAWKMLGLSNNWSVKRIFKAIKGLISTKEARERNEEFA